MRAIRAELGATIRLVAPAPLADLTAHVAGLVVPPGCGACGMPCPARTTLCETCRRDVVAHPARQAPLAGLDAAWSAAAYRGSARSLVAGLKFGRRLALANEAAALIAARLPQELIAGPLVPVPPAPARRRARGFDSAERIASALAAELGRPAWPCLARANSRRQVGRPRVERLADPPAVRLIASPPREATLVDDVVTTGATLAACAAALRAGGCGRVVALTFARS